MAGLDELPERVNGNAALVRRGRFLSTTFLVGIGETECLVRIAEGRIAEVRHGPFTMPSWRFALRAPEAAWQRFWEKVPPPGYNDLLALLRRGELKIEGDLQPFMANLLYMKAVLAAPRGGAAR
jgi:hypothetical protein